MRKSLLEINYSKIESLARSRYLYNHEQLRDLFNQLKTEKTIPQSLSFIGFYEYLLKIGLVKFEITLNEWRISRYSFDKQIDVYRLAISLKKNSFFSMSTALNLYGYSNYRNDFIFVSCESPKKELEYSALTQENIDRAFHKPYRRTQSVEQFNDKNIVFLTPKYTGKFAIIHEKFPTSSINRAFVEMIINVQYFRTSLEIIQTYIPLKSKIDLNQVFNIVKAFDLIYPYFQCVGFYLEKLGFQKEELTAFKERVSDFKFYTDKNQNNYLFDSYWQMFYISHT
ncbi:MAG: hypothetical protein K2X04_11420 [Burkholderiales bacterium]|nr:hypothetical protein [Burkholderiales bacterium]